MNKKKFTIDWSKTMAKVKEHEKAKTGFKDERIYYPQFSEDGTAQAVIRFLPQKVGETDFPWVTVWSHSFRGPGGWFIDNCLTTLGAGTKCPVCEANGAIWDDAPETARARKRKLSYYSNILVVNDIKNPENNGKVFLFKYGKKIHEKIMEKLSPPEGGILKPVHVHDYYTGANFNLIIKKTKVNGVIMPNYDSSTFEGSSEIGNDEAIEKIAGLMFSLKDFLAPTNFKTYDELKARFDRVVGQSLAGNTDKAPDKPATPAAKASDSASADEPAPNQELFQGTDASFFESLKKE